MQGCATQEARFIWLRRVIATLVMRGTPSGHSEPPLLPLPRAQLFNGIQRLIWAPRSHGRLTAAASLTAASLTAVAASLTAVAASLTAAASPTAWPRSVYAERGHLLWPHVR